MEPVEKVYRSRAKMLLDNFLGGIVWAVGVWVGTTVIIAVLIYFISRIDFIPIIGDFIAKITEHVAKENSFLPF